MRFHRVSALWCYVIIYGIGIDRMTWWSVKLLTMVVMRILTIWLRHHLLMDLRTSLVLAGLVMCALVLGILLMSRRKVIVRLHMRILLVRMRVTLTLLIYTSMIYHFMSARRNSMTNLISLIRVRRIYLVYWHFILYHRSITCDG